MCLSLFYRQISSPTVETDHGKWSTLLIEDDIQSLFCSTSPSFGIQLSIMEVVVKEGRVRRSGVVTTSSTAAVFPLNGLFNVKDFEHPEEFHSTSSSLLQMASLTAEITWLSQGCTPRQNPCTMPSSCSQITDIGLHGHILSVHLSNFVFPWAENPSFIDAVVMDDVVACLRVHSISSVVGASRDG